jgi:hypothetical protein
VHVTPRLPEHRRALLPHLYARSAHNQSHTYNLRISNKYGSV